MVPQTRSTVLSRLRIKCVAQLPDHPIRRPQGGGYANLAPISSPKPIESRRESLKTLGSNSKRLLQVVTTPRHLSTTITCTPTSTAIPTTTNSMALQASSNSSTKWLRAPTGAPPLWCELTRHVSRSSSKDRRASQGCLPPIQPSKLRGPETPPSSTCHLL